MKIRCLIGLHKYEEVTRSHFPMDTDLVNEECVKCHKRRTRLEPWTERRGEESPYMRTGKPQ